MSTCFRLSASTSIFSPSELLIDSPISFHQWVPYSCFTISAKFRTNGSSHFLQCILSEKAFRALSQLPGLPLKWKEIMLLQRRTARPNINKASSSSPIYARSRCSNFLLYLIKLHKNSIDFTWIPGGFGGWSSSCGTGRPFRRKALIAPLFAYWAMTISL